MPVEKSSYDELPYPNAPLDYCQSRRLEAIATWFGMEPPPIPTARVLELGCGDGSHLLPQADCYPEAEFVGVDLAESQIAKGRAVAAAAGLTNIELHQGDVRQIDDDWGQFDYIIAHGLFSWVPPEVQDALLGILRDHLAPTGVAFVSYNALPGWHRRMAVRDVMLEYTEQYSDLTEQTSEARRILQWVADSARSGSSYRSYLEEESELLRGKPDGYVYHEYLERHNHPIYFRDFMARSASAGLQYLGEAILPHMLPLDLPARARDVVAKLPLVEGEQLMDFVRNRTFRRTLLCHQDVSLDRNTGPSSLEKFRLCLATEVQGSGIDLRDPQPLHITLGGSEISVAQPLAKAAVAELCDAFPASVGLADLLNGARQRLADVDLDFVSDDPAQQNSVATLVWQWVTYGVIEFCLHPEPFVVEVSPQPTASPLARYQATTGGLVTNRKHAQVPLDDCSRRIITLLDGKHSRADVIRQVTDEVAAGQVAPPNSQHSAADDTSIEHRIATALARLGRQALLVA